MALRNIEPVVLPYRGLPGQCGTRDKYRDRVFFYRRPPVFFGFLEVHWCRQLGTGAKYPCGGLPMCTLAPTITTVSEDEVLVTGVVSAHLFGSPGWAQGEPKCWGGSAAMMVSSLFAAWAHMTVRHHMAACHHRMACHHMMACQHILACHHMMGCRHRIVSHHMSSHDGMSSQDGISSHGGVITGWYVIT